jgi:hypothetical protein
MQKKMFKTSVKINKEPQMQGMIPAPMASCYKKKIAPELLRKPSHEQLLCCQVIVLTVI